MNKKKKKKKKKKKRTMIQVNRAKNPDFGAV